MVLVRKTVFEEMPKTFKIGDELVFNTNSFGVVSATCQKVDDNTALFICDDCVAEMYMNKNNSNTGGFEQSDLKDWLENNFIPELPSFIRNHLIKLSIPTYGMIFGHDNLLYENLEPDNDEQLPLMKSRKCRIAYFKEESEWWWLQNATKQSVSSVYFAGVRLNGLINDYLANDYNADTDLGVRPYFVISIDK